MLELEEIRERMETQNLKKVSRKLNWSYRKLYYALKSDDPKYKPLKALSDFLEGSEMIAENK